MQVRLTGEGLRLTGDPAGSRAGSAGEDPFALATEDGETLAADAGDHLSRDPDHGG